MDDVESEEKDLNDEEEEELLGLLPSIPPETLALPVRSDELDAYLNQTTVELEEAKSAGEALAEFNFDLDLNPNQAQVHDHDHEREQAQKQE